MKTIFSALFILVSLAAGAQDDLYYTPEPKPGDIPKKANTIIITTSSVDMQMFTKVSDLLFENGYGIQSSDEEHGNITTTEKGFKDGSLKLTFLIKANRILVRGNCRISISLNFGAASTEPDWQDIIYFGMKKSPMMLAWNEMAKITNSLPGEKEYLVK
jgi:hypothetical protein